MSQREDREARMKKRRQARGIARHLEETRLLEAERRWRGGYVIPARITQALDLRELYGPEVDSACGVAEPTVDRWEAGEVYPTWPQLRALSRLTGLGERWFTDAIPWRHIDKMFICDRRRRAWTSMAVLPQPILRASREALAAHRGLLEVS